MKRLKRFWYLFPVMLSLLALLVVLLPTLTVAATEIGQVSNKLISPVVATAQEEAAILSWRTGVADYHQGDLALTLRTGGASIGLDIRAVSATTQNISGAELRARYTPGVISITGATEIGTSGVYLLGTFDLLALQTVDVSLSVASVGAGTTNLEVWLTDPSLLP